LDTAHLCDALLPGSEEIPCRSLDGTVGLVENSALCLRGEMGADRRLVDTSPDLVLRSVSLGLGACVPSLELRHTRLATELKACLLASPTATGIGPMSEAIAFNEQVRSRLGESIGVSLTRRMRDHLVAESERALTAAKEGLKRLQEGEGEGQAGESDGHERGELEQRVIEYQEELSFLHAGYDKRGKTFPNEIDWDDLKAIIKAPGTAGGAGRR